MTHLPHIRPLTIGLENTTKEAGFNRLCQTIGQGEFLAPGSQTIGSVTINFGKSVWGMDCVVRSEDEARKLISIMMDAATEYLRTRVISDINPESSPKTS